MRGSIKALVCVSVFAGSSGAFGAGFEKSVMWSGHYVGVAGAAVSSVSGSQSLYFNPAGLASATGDVSLNYSPSWINVDGSLVTPARVDQSRNGWLPFGGAFASLVAGRFGFGMGAYLAGGEKAIYPSVDISPDAGFLNYVPTLETDLMIVEYSIGAAYEILPGLRFGAAWRISHAKGTLSTIQKTVNNQEYVHVMITDAKDTEYNGFRLGVQYQEPENRWGVGAAYRSKLTFDATGTGSGATLIIPFDSVTNSVVLNPRAGLVFPDAYSLGAHYALFESLKVLAGADFVRYSLDDKVNVSGTIDGTPLPNIPLYWSDMWNLRLGFEYTGIPSWALRAGYAHTTRTTSTTNAKATEAPPGPGNLFTVGAGWNVAMPLDIDVALEYGHSSGVGSMSMPAAGALTKELLAGVNTETKASSYAGHLGVTYRF